MGKKIKIAFFSPASAPFFVEKEKANFGGAEYQMYLLAKELSKNDSFNISFFADIDERKKEGQIKILPSRTFSANNGLLKKICKSFAVFYRFTRLKPDIILTTTYNPVAGIASLYAQLSGKKHLHRIANDADTDLSRISAGGIAGKVYRYGLEKADAVFCQNKRQKELLARNHGIDAATIKNGFEVKSPSASVKKKHVLWVGRMTPQKQPELFLKFAQAHSRTKCKMVCPYHPEQKLDWLKLKAEADKIPNLELIERVPFFQIQELFNKALLFLNTSDYEGFPNTFLQAAQAQTPIASLEVNPDNFITDYNCGIFAEGKFDILLKESGRLLSNSELIQKKGQNAYQYLRKHHSITTTGKQLSELIIKLADAYYK